MQHKWMVLFAALMIVSLALAPAGAVQAQMQSAGDTPECPLYHSALLNDPAFLNSLPPECVKAYKSLAKETDTTVEAQSVQPLSSGGPDGFGYTYYDTTYNWISAATNSGLTGDDQYTGPINIGFSFPFYGMSQSQLYFSTNGLITFGSGSQEWDSSYFVSEAKPNNLIAPYGDDLAVGSPYNSGAIYYSQGGTSPNRYFVMEWRNVSTHGSSTPFTFEAILYENGDIVFQYQSLPASCCGTVHAVIEDSDGYNALGYYFGTLSVPKAARFYYPTPAARLRVSPRTTGQFVTIGGHADYTLTIANIGGLGPDTYDFTSTFTWPAALYASNGTTPLTDTDADGKLDTGSIPQGTTATVVVRVDTPAGANVGDTNDGQITIASTLNTSVTNTVHITTTIPTDFASVFQDGSDGAMSFLTTHSDAIHRYKVTADNYGGYEVAVQRLANENYFYAWAKDYFNGTRWVSNIEYTLLTRQGGTVVPVTRLTDNSGAANSVFDAEPSIALTPNGTVGVVWSRYIYDQATGKSLSNVYLVTLNSSGSFLAGPTNITNNSVWDDGTTPNAPYYFDVTTAGSDDNRFVIGWLNEMMQNAGISYGEIWYAIRNTDGTSIVAPKAQNLGGGFNRRPVLNSLKNGRVILTWIAYTNTPYYAVINSDGSFARPMTPLGNRTHFLSTDAVQLPNGKIAAAWGDELEMQFGILNSSFVIESLSTIEYYANTLPGDFFSVTTDDSSQVIMSWGSRNEQFYALGDSTGNFTTYPVVYRTSADGIEMSSNGQGNASYQPGNAVHNNGADTTGVFRPSNGYLFMKNTNETGYADWAFNYGIGGDYPVVGDWDGNGSVTLGVYRAGKFYLRNENTNGFAELVFIFGQAGDQPVAGDWDGDGIDTIGVYRGNTFYLRNSNTAGAVDKSFSLGNAGDVGIAGDWNGDGVDTTGVFRPSNGYLFLKNTNETGFADWALNYGLSGDKPVTGDWNGDGVDTIGVYRGNTFYLRNSNTNGFADISFALGNHGDMPIAGDWDGLP